MSFAYTITSAPGQPLRLAPRSLATDGGEASGSSHPPDAVEAALRRPAIFLSASANTERDDEADNIAAAIHQRHGHRAGAGWQSDFLHDIQSEDHQHPRRVQRAVSWLSTFALERGYTLIFGGHPAISPMVLEIARRHVPGRNEIRVIVFQSELWADVIPLAAKDLARWPHGCMITTPPVNGDKNESLTLMRQLMLASAGLQAGVYIGGMGGLLEESYLFGDLCGGPRYAIASTGGASKYLLEALERDHGGRSADSELVDALANCRSYPAVMDQIFDDLGPPP